MTTTATTFEDYCAIHKAQRIMEAGLGARPIESYMPVPEEPERDMIVYGVGTSTWAAFELGFVFRTREDAETVLDLEHFSLAKEAMVKSDLQVYVKKIWSPEALKAYADTIEQIRKATDHNSPIKFEIAEYDKKLKDIHASLFDEWAEIETARRQTQHIKNTYLDYLKTAKNDADVAFSFLAKTFGSYSHGDLREIISGCWIEPCGQEAS